VFEDLSERSFDPATETAVLAEEIAMIEAELKRRRWRKNPALWVRERLGEFAWSKQREIMMSVVSNRRTAVHSCHGAGKSYIAARIAAWWIDIHPPGEAFVVTSATTGDQVKAILWREIGRAQAKGLPGRVNQTEWFLTMENGREELVAIGRKPSDYNPTAFQGIHARWVLVIFDEAGGIAGGSSDQPHSLWESADSLIANDDSRMLAIGNPDNPSGEFARACAPGSGWNAIGIDAFETPNFTEEEVPEALRTVLIGRTWVEEKRRKWGEDNPLWIAKIRGLFPQRTADGLIPLDWIRAAQLRVLVPKTPEEQAAAATWLHELGVDVGAGGGGKNTVAERRGPIIRIIRRDQEPDTMKSCGNLLYDLRRTKASRAKVDEVGVGRGLVDRALEQAAPVVGVNVGRPAKDKEAYENVRAEGYWLLRDRFEEGNIDIDPVDDDLAAQLVDLRFKRSSHGRILIESKDEMKRRGRASPDDADAVMLAFLPDELLGPQPVRELPVLWG
jgi:hypothetical protein